jgi:hypothetical protein
VSPVKYELALYIPEDAVLHEDYSHSRVHVLQKARDNWKADESLARSDKFRSSLKAALLRSNTRNFRGFCGPMTVLCRVSVGSAAFLTAGNHLRKLQTVTSQSAAAGSCPFPTALSVLTPVVDADQWSCSRRGTHGT